MANNDNYMKVARQIADYLNAFRLAFKTYNATELNAMMKAVAGSGARVDGKEVFEKLQAALLQRGFKIYPQLEDAQDGYVRVIRANSVVGSLLNAFMYVGADGDEELARLLVSIKRRRQSDDLATDGKGGEEVLG